MICFFKEENRLAIITPQFLKLIMPFVVRIFSVDCSMLFILGPVDVCVLDEWFFASALLIADVSDGTPRVFFMINPRNGM